MSATERSKDEVLRGYERVGIEMSSRESVVRSLRHMDDRSSELNGHLDNISGTLASALKVQKSQLKALQGIDSRFPHIVSADSLPAVSLLIYGQTDIKCYNRKSPSPPGSPSG